MSIVLSDIRSSGDLDVRSVNHYKTGLAVRSIKIALLATMGIYFGIVGIDNLIDYGANFGMVQHVLRMDSISSGRGLHWRSIHSPTLHHLTYWLVIVWEFSAALLCDIGAISLLRSCRSARDFNGSKRYGVLGLGLGAILWLFAFITVGGEWFLMWQSPWNGEMAAFRMFTVNITILILLVLSDGE